jgi:hypothetical protein
VKPLDDDSVGVCDKQQRIVVPTYECPKREAPYAEVEGKKDPEK